jgi:hypothetical protein
MCIHNARAVCIVASATHQTHLRVLSTLECLCAPAQELRPQLLAVELAAVAMCIAAAQLPEQLS